MLRGSKTRFLLATVALIAAALPAGIVACAGMTNEQQREAFRLAGHVVLDLDALSRGGATEGEIANFKQHIEAFVALVPEGENRETVQKAVNAINTGATLAIGYESYRLIDPDHNKLRAVARALLDA